MNKSDFHFGLIDNIILNTIAQGQKKEDAYISLIQKFSKKKHLAQIHKELTYTRDEIQQGKWVPKVTPLSASEDFVLQSYALPNDGVHTTSRSMRKGKEKEQAPKPSKVQTNVSETKVLEVPENVPDEPIQESTAVCVDSIKDEIFI